MMQALLANGTLGWDIPSECAPSCDCTVIYDASGLKCYDLQPDQISDGVNETNYESSWDRPPRPVEDVQAYLTSYDDDLAAVFAVLNVTSQDASASVANHTIFNSVTQTTSYDPTAEQCLYNVTVAYLPCDQDTNRSIADAVGMVCTFYNTTYQADVSYSNGTQLSTVSILRYNAPLNTTLKLFIPYDDSDSAHTPADPFFDIELASGLNLIAMAEAFVKNMGGDLQWYHVEAVLAGDNYSTIPFVALTNLFNITTGDGSNFPLRPTPERG